MFRELAPIIRQRTVLLSLNDESDKIRVNIFPKKRGEDENTALTTALSVIGTPEELDRDLPAAIVDYVASYLTLKASLERSKAEMDAAAKAAQAEARAKTAKVQAAKKEGTDKAKTATNSTPSKVVVEQKPEPPKMASLFDVQDGAGSAATPGSSTAAPANHDKTLAGVSDGDDDDDDDDDDASILEEIAEDRRSDEGASVEA